MADKSKTIGWITIVLAVLIALDVLLGWADGLNWLWVIVALIIGIWGLTGQKTEAVVEPAK